MLYGGLLTGFLYDLFRLIRRIFRLPLVQVLCDVLFCVCALLCAGLVLLFATGGELRGYPLLGLFLGFALQQYSISALFFSLYHRLLGRLFLTRSRKSR